VAIVIPVVGRCRNSLPSLESGDGFFELVEIENPKSPDLPLEFPSYVNSSKDYGRPFVGGNSGPIFCPLWTTYTSLKHSIQ